MDWIKSASIEMQNTVFTKSDGDLWPCAWGDDDFLYTANGDGKGFDLQAPWCDIVMNRISGEAGSLHGERLSDENGVGGVFADPAEYNRKPTGIVCADGQLYLVVQNLNKSVVGGFDDVPCATICRSTDKGKSWEFDEKTPMFRDYQFTTIFFLDYGKDNCLSPDGYIYAYGMDNNWRASFSKRVEDPVCLYLARVKPEQIMDRSGWAFFCGMEDGEPVFSKDMSLRKPVLEDARKVTITPPPDQKDRVMESTVISQGSVVYNQPLNRYLYSSWTENTFEFYEAPAPWGPFRLFLSKDFGTYPWTQSHHGGYATVIPSKFISPDGKTMYVVSCTFVGGVKQYGFYLRKLTVEI